jgi:hypothetical protein
MEIMMKRLATPDDRDQPVNERSRLRPRRRHIKKLVVTALFVAVISTATFADTEWTDYVVPGTQTGTQTAYQPLYRGAPGDTYDTPMCQKGEIGTDSAWYRVCICYGGPCFITYYSIASYKCPDGTSLWVVTARGKTDKKCGKTGVTATREIFRKLGGETYGGYNPGGVTDESFASDSEVSRLIVDEGKRPDENSKKSEEKKETKEEKKETATGGGGSGSGGTNKRPRKRITKNSTRTHARRETGTHGPTETGSTGGGPEISIGIGIGRLGGFGGHGRGGERKSDE